MTRFSSYLPYSYHIGISNRDISICEVMKLALEAVRLGGDFELEASKQGSTIISIVRNLYHSNQNLTKSGFQKRVRQSKKSFYKVFLLDFHRTFHVTNEFLLGIQNRSLLFGCFCLQ